MSQIWSVFGLYFEKKSVFSEVRNRIKNFKGEQNFQNLHSRLNVLTDFSAFGVNFEKFVRVPPRDLFGGPLMSIVRFTTMSLFLVTVS